MRMRMTITTKTRIITITEITKTRIITKSQPYHHHHPQQK